MSPEDEKNSAKNSTLFGLKFGVNPDGKAVACVAGKL